jgi:hypothetical protein
MKTLHIILISDLWEKYHRKEFTKEIVRKISENGDSLVVQLPVSLFVHIFTNIRRILNFLLSKYKIRKIAENTFLYTPFILFHYLLWEKSEILFKIDFFLMNFQLNRTIRKRYGDRKLILWVYFPFLYRFAKNFKKDFVIYDQYDIYHMDINGVTDSELKSLNDELIKISDLVLNTTKYLYDISKVLNNNSYYITNGNNFELLSKTKKTTAKINLPIKGAKTIGYLGGIRDWIDFDLLEYIIKRKSDVNFLFIGTVLPTAKKKMDKIKIYKNVLWLNYIQPENLSSYLSLFDAGLIPFKTTEFFKCVFPNKFFEYLASGIPVISTGLPELEKYKNIFGYSNSNMEFLENCERALNGYYYKYIDTYLKLAKENSWSEKTNEITIIIEKVFVENNIINELS